MDGGDGSGKGPGEVSDQRRKRDYRKVDATQSVRGHDEMDGRTASVGGCRTFQVLCTCQYPSQNKSWFTPFSLTRKPSPLTGHTDFISAIDFNPAGTVLISGSWDKRIGVWSTPECALISWMEGHQDKVYCVAASLDGKFIVSGGGSGELFVWNATSFTKETRVGWSW